MKDESPKPKPIDPADRRRIRALVCFQILVYGYLLTMWGIQAYMYATRDW